MEDILASIRKIIDEDEKKEAPAATAGTVDAEAASSDDEVMDLTEVVEENEPEDADEPLDLTEIVEADETPCEATDDKPGGEDLVQAQDRGDAQVQEESVEAAPAYDEPEMPIAAEAEAVETPPADHAPDNDPGEDAADAVPEQVEEEQHEAEDTMSDNGLISDQTRSSAAAALGNLARASERDPLDGIPQGRPVEALVMEQLKPMLSAWLDEHLPAIVERIVEREVRYLSRRLENDDRT